MKFEDFMYWLPGGIAIIILNIYFIYKKSYSTICLELILFITFLFYYLWIKYWLNRKYKKEKNQEKDYY